MNHSFLHLENVSKTYPSGFTLKIDRLKIDGEERVGLVGNNGAGKTTLMLLTLGLIRFDGGGVRMNGVDIKRTSKWRRMVASYLGEASLITFLTPTEYWSFVAAAYDTDHIDFARRLRRYEDLHGVSAPDKRLIREFSAGSRKKIGLVAAMIVRPALLILDEPFAGLDPRSQAALLEALSDLNREYGTTLFVSSHDLGHVVDLSSRIVVLDGGRVAQDAPVCAGSMRDITAYLTGGSSSGMSRSPQGSQFHTTSVASLRGGTNSGARLGRFPRRDDVQ